MRNLFWGIILIGLGILLLLDNLEIANFREIISQYWPLIIILWGFTFLGRRHPKGAEISASPALEYDLLHQSSVFGDISLKISSKNFKGGSLSTIFGNFSLDLSDAAIASGEHILQIHSIFGDSVITLPENGAVSISANTVFGGLSVREEKKGGFSPQIKSSSSGFDIAPNRLRINISKVFGNIRVI